VAGLVVTAVGHTTASASSQAYPHRGLYRPLVAQEGAIITLGGDGHFNTGNQVKVATHADSGSELKARDE
jgi:hypothetical protein